MDLKVLLVDDDPNILAAYKRKYRKDFHLATANSGDEGLIVNGTEGPFAVVISDYRMPGMDGIEFLAKIKEHSPDTVRIMLTGNNDIKTAIEAVNSGNVFRFLNKPCLPDDLKKSIEAGFEQYKLITAEKELLKNTLTGSIKVLVEILSMVNPEAFSKAIRMRKYLRHIAGELHLPDVWKYEVAAMLSQIGCVTIPGEVLSKSAIGATLDEEDVKMLGMYTQVSANLVNNIPRLEDISQMIENQKMSYQEFSSSSTGAEDDIISLGAQMLRAANDFDRLLISGEIKKNALQKLSLKPNIYNKKVVEALNSLVLLKEEKGVKYVNINNLRYGMIAYEDIRSKSGIMLVAKGQEVTYPVMMRLRNFAGRVGVEEPFRVVMPEGDQ